MKREIIISSGSMSLYNLSYQNCLAKNLISNGYDIAGIYCTSVKYFRNYRRRYRFLFEKIYLTIENKDNEVFTLIASEYPSNCSSLFIRNTNLPDDLFEAVLACSGYTFAFFNSDRFNSTRISEFLFMKHINVDYKYIKNSDKINIKTSKIEDGLILNGGFIKNNPSFMFHNPFDNYVNFIYCFNRYGNPINEKYSFLIDILGPHHFSYRNNYELIYSAVANRTKNNLGIFVHRSLL